jgi:hypothetical protein
MNSHEKLERPMLPKIQILKENVWSLQTRDKERFTMLLTSTAILFGTTVFVRLPCQVMLKRDFGVDIGGKEITTKQRNRFSYFMNHFS